MKPEIGFMGQLSTKNVLDDLNFAVSNGFDWFEIGLDWKQNYKLNPETIKKIRETSKNHEIKLIVHAAWYLPTSTMIPEVRKGVIENIKKGIILANKVGSDRLTIHAGYREMPAPAIQLCYESLIHNLKRIVGIGKKCGVNVCFENSDRNSYNLCSELKDFLMVLSSVRGLKATLDIGHTNTTDTKPAEYFNAVKDFVMDMHIHDNNGKLDEHKCLGEGNIDFVKVFSECKKEKYSGPFVLELFPYENILKGRRVFLELWKRA